MSIWNIRGAVSNLVNTRFDIINFCKVASMSVRGHLEFTESISGSEVADGIRMIGRGVDKLAPTSDPNELTFGMYEVQVSAEQFASFSEQNANCGNFISKVFNTIEGLGIAETAVVAIHPPIVPNGNAVDDNWILAYRVRCGVVDYGDGDLRPSSIRAMNCGSYAKYNATLIKALPRGLQECIATALEHYPEAFSIDRDRGSERDYAFII